MGTEGKYININVSIANRDFGLTIKEEDMEIIRNAEKIIQDRLTELSNKYQTVDRNDHLSMALLLLCVDHLRNQEAQSSVEEMSIMLDGIDNKLTDFFNPA